MSSPATHGRRSNTAALVAAALGVASAAVSAYWALGGTGLLDTVGGEIERWGRQRSAGVVATLWVVVFAKLAAAAAPLVWVNRRSPHLLSCVRSRSVSATGWIISIGLTVYGGFLTAVGLLIQLGLVEAADDADEHALVWHTYFWDPWFLLWGGAATAAMWWSRSNASM